MANSSGGARKITGGSLLASVVPIPAAIWLFGSGRLGMDEA
jgi:hypothetical protein